MTILPRLRHFAAGDIKQDDIARAGGFAAAGGECFAIGTEAHGVHAVGKEVLLLQCFFESPPGLAARSELGGAGGGDAAAVNLSEC
jgi:hypothetical protein